jgi:hypothetical protein
MILHGRLQSAAGISVCFGAASASNFDFRISVCLLFCVGNLALAICFKFGVISFGWPLPMILHERLHQLLLSRHLI